MINRFKERVENEINKIESQKEYSRQKLPKEVLKGIATCNTKKAFNTPSEARQKGSKIYKCRFCCKYHRTTIPVTKSLTYFINKKVKKQNG